MDNSINKSVTSPKPKLLDQVRTVIRTKHYRLRTEEAYIYWIKKYIFYHQKRHPVEMGKAEIQLFLNHLAIKEKVSAATQNQALCALVFLYKHVLQQEMGDLGELIWAKTPKRLPVVFTRDEARAVLNQLTGTNWIMGNLLHGAGLRLTGCLELRVKDLDFSYKQITVRIL